MQRHVIEQKTMPTAFWALSIKDTLKTLDATAKGLDDKTVKARIKTYGPNTIPEKTRLARTAIAFNQFKSPLISVLFVAALVSLFLKEWVDAGFIFAAVGINTLMGYWQENKAETALEHLKSYIRMRVRVRRNNQELELDAENLVPGDIITLTQGDRVPADARIILTNRCLVDESILTGESLPIEKNATTLPKDTQLAERRCFLHSGTLIVDGFVEAVVTLTGKNTEFGKLAELTAKHVSEKTPLQKAVTHFAFWTGGLIGLFTLVLFVSGLFAGYALKDMFLIAVAIGISAVPEGLPVTLTVILAVGVERLAKRKGVVRKLLAAETLGSTSLILTDKTGTLTLAQMNLTSILPYRATDAEAEKNLLALALNNTDVLVENHSAQPDKWRISGSPEEAAIVRAAGKLLLPIKTADRKITITDRIPFSSERKYSMVSIKPANEEEMTIAMGAPEIIIGFTA
ncbi:MAG: HAD-IC family P-type ATPase, partial [Patescibacteria group bacterium]